MLENVKSRYILEIIFSNINDGIKLNLIKFNKKIKLKLDINLLHYKLYSGRYFIGKRNGKGKEYNSFNHKLVFEGEYLEGKRAGCGKEYFFDENKQLNIKVYEGKYLNGKRNQKGTEYYSYGKFEGIYISGDKYSGKR